MNKELRKANEPKSEDPLLNDTERRAIINSIPEAQWGCGSCSERLIEAQLKKAESWVRQDERERIIEEIGRFDKRHTVSFVLQCLKATAEKEG